VREIWCVLVSQSVSQFIELRLMEVICTYYRQLTLCPYTYEMFVEKRESGKRSDTLFTNDGRSRQDDLRLLLKCDNEIHKFAICGEFFFIP
jgi:hypothetical protein